MTIRANATNIEIIFLVFIIILRERVTESMRACQTQAERLQEPGLNALCHGLPMSLGFVDQLPPWKNNKNCPHTCSDRGADCPEDYSCQPRIISVVALGEFTQHRSNARADQRSNEEPFTV